MSAQHAMAVLKVFRSGSAQGWSQPGACRNCDYALRATEVMAQALGRVMSTLVVQEHCLWLNLAEMQDVEKVCFLYASISQVGDIVVEFAQQFSMVKNKNKWRPLNTSCIGVAQVLCLYP